MLQRDHTATQHAVSYREGTSVGNGCGVRGQSEGEEEDRKTIKKSEDGEGDTEKHFPVKQFESKFCMSHTLFQMSSTTASGSAPTG